MSCTASAVSHKSQTIAAKKQFYLYLIFSSSLLGFFLPSHWEFWSYLSVLRPKQLNKIGGEVKKLTNSLSIKRILRYCQSVLHILNSKF